MAKLSKKRRQELIVERFDLWRDFILAQFENLDVCSTAYLEWEVRPELLNSFKRLRKHIAENLNDGEYREDFYNLKINEAKRLSSFVQNELKNGLPILHTHALIAMWSAFEALVYDVAKLWVQCYPKKLNHSRLQDFKIAASDFYAMTDNERLETIFEYIENKNKDKQFGAERFNEILNCVGLGGLLAEDISERMYKLTCIRNLIVHRSGLIDKEFKKQCYWKSVKVGDKFTLEFSGYANYVGALVDYMEILANRIEEKSGIEVIIRTKKSE